MGLHKQGTQKLQQYFGGRGDHSTTQDLSELKELKPGTLVAVRRFADIHAARGIPNAEPVTAFLPVEQALRLAASGRVMLVKGMHGHVLVQNAEPAES